MNFYKGYNSTSMSDELLQSCVNSWKGTITNLQATIATHEDEAKRGGPYEFHMEKIKHLNNCVETVKNAVSNLLEFEAKLRASLMQEYQEELPKEIVQNLAETR